MVRILSYKYLLFTLIKDKELSNESDQEMYCFRFQV